MDDDAIEYMGEPDVDPTMLAQIELEAKIESYEKITEDVKNGISPF